MRSAKDTLLRKIAVGENVSVGDSFHVGPFSRLWAPNQLTVGSRVYVGKHVTIEVDGRIGDGTLVANNVGIVGRLDHDFRTVGVPVRDAPWVGDFPNLSRATDIGADVWLGFGVVVLSGVSIGDSSVVAAGQLIREDIPPNTIVTGASKDKWRARFTDEEYLEHWSALSQIGIRRLVDRA